LNYESFHADLDQVIDRARSHGISQILIPGTDLISSRVAFNIASRSNGLYAAVGVHPNDALSWQDQTIESIQEMASQDEVCAVGEIGLDYYRDHAPRPLQLQILKVQLDLASVVQKPVVLHSRSSLEDLLYVLAEWVEHLRATNNPLAANPGVLHSFEGNLKQARHAVALGFKIGISGPVTYKNAREKHDLAQGLDMSAILLETDAPFLSPHPYRGQRNEPAFIPLIAQKIADLRSISVEKVAQTTTSNAFELFSWS
jgi:TatD DNase family protein